MKNDDERCQWTSKKTVNTYGTALPDVCVCIYHLFWRNLYLENNLFVFAQFTVKHSMMYKVQIRSIEKRWNDLFLSVWSLHNMTTALLALYKGHRVLPLAIRWLVQHSANWETVPVLINNYKTLCQSWHSICSFNANQSS